MGHNSLKNYLSFIWNWNWTGHRVFYRTILAPPPESESVSLSVWSDSLQACGLQHARLLCPWNSPGKNTGVGSHSLLQEIFLTQGLNLSLPRLLHWQAAALLLHHLGSPFHLVWEIRYQPKKRPKALRSGGFQEATTLITLYLTSKSTNPRAQTFQGPF